MFVFKSIFDAINHFCKYVIINFYGKSRWYTISNNVYETWGEYDREKR